MKPLLSTRVWLLCRALPCAALLLCTTLPAQAVPLFSGTDSADYDVIATRMVSITGTSALVLLIQSRAVRTKDYVVTLRSLAPESNRALIAEARFRDGQEEGEPYAVWLDSCFAADGTLCNGSPPVQERLTLAKLIEKIESIYQRQRPH